MTILGFISSLFSIFQVKSVTTHAEPDPGQHLESKPDHLDDRPEAKRETNLDLYEQYRAARLATRAWLPFQCFPSCSEIDILIAYVISSDLKREVDEHILPSVEDANDCLVLNDPVWTNVRLGQSNDLSFGQRSETHTNIHGIDIEHKYITQIIQARHLSLRGWSIEAILVYLKLARRGYEPLLSKAWEADFPKFPETLFTNDEEKVLIKSCKPYATSQGASDFDRFCRIGGDIRSAEEKRKTAGQIRVPGKNATKIAHKAIQNYIKAVWKDAKLLDPVLEGRLPEIIFIIRGSPSLAQTTLQKRARELLEFLQVKYEDGEEHCEMRQFILTPPILFGIVPCGTVVGVMACEPLSPNMDIRNVAFYHFDKQHEEVWNCISLAVLIHWARESMLRISRGMAIDLDRKRLEEDPDL